ncbi:unnamed protein product [Camellia sinensis]
MGIYLRKTILVLSYSSSQATDFILLCLLCWFVRFDLQPNRLSKLQNLLGLDFKLARL